MVKALVLGYVDIIPPVSINDTNYYIRVDVKYFDNVLNNSNLLNVDILVDASDNQQAIENKIFDGIVDAIGTYGSTLTKGDILMLAFKRGN